MVRNEKVFLKSVCKYSSVHASKNTPLNEFSQRRRITNEMRFEVGGTKWNIKYVIFNSKINIPVCRIYAKRLWLVFKQRAWVSHLLLSSHTRVYIVVDRVMTRMKNFCSCRVRRRVKRFTHCLTFQRFRLKKRETLSTKYFVKYFETVLRKRYRVD